MAPFFSGNIDMWAYLSEPRSSQGTRKNSNLLTHRNAPVVGGLAGGVAPPYCSYEYRAYRGVRRVMSSYPSGSGNPLRLALSLKV
jgi:hypothetical protein